MQCNANVITEIIKQTLNILLFRIFNNERLLKYNAEVMLVYILSKTSLFANIRKHIT